MRAEAVAGVVALKFPVYVPSARWIVSPGPAAPSAVFSWAAVVTSTVVAAEAVPVAVRSRPPVLRVVTSREVNGVRMRMGCLPVCRISYMNDDRHAELGCREGTDQVTGRQGVPPEMADQRRVAGIPLFRGALSMGNTRRSGHSA